MLRGEFCSGVIALATAASSPMSPRSVDHCDINPTVPFGRPLEFGGDALDGPYFDLKAYRGYAMWITMFATWCPPCNDEQPMIVDAARRYYDSGLRVVGIFSDDPDDRVREYRKKYGIAYPLVRDQSYALSRILEGRTKAGPEYPSHLFLTAWGTLYCYVASEIDARTADYKIGKLLTTVSSPLPPSPAAT